MLPFSSLLNIKSQVFFSKAGLHANIELDSFALEWKKKLKSRSSEMNTFSRKPTLPKSNIAPKKIGHPQQESTFPTTTPRKFNSSPLKIGLLGKGNSSSFPIIFQGRAVQFRGVYRFSLARYLCCRECIAFFFVGPQILGHSDDSKVITFHKMYLVSFLGGGVK